MPILAACGLLSGSGSARHVRVSAVSTTAPWWSGSAHEPVDGKATEAAVAGSFGVHRSTVRLVSGASSRTKIIDADAGDPYGHAMPPSERVP